MLSARQTQKTSHCMIPFLTFWKGTTLGAKISGCLMRDYKGVQGTFWGDGNSVSWLSWWLHDWCIG